MAHFNNYTTLKHKDPKCAREQLSIAAHLLHKGHPKAECWAERVYQMDTIGVNLAVPRPGRCGFAAYAPKCDLHS